MSSIPADVERALMVAHQIRPFEVLDERVLARLGEVPREIFVPPHQRALAYADATIPLGRGQVMLPPAIDARLVQAVNVQPGDHVLEVGTGSGYLTAVLAGLADHVHSVEIIPEFKVRAARNLETLGVHNVTLEVGDASRGWGRHKPYDVILVSGALPLGPAPAFRESLAVGGRMVVIVGGGPAEVRLITRVTPDYDHEESLFETDVPALVNAPKPERFQF